MMTFGCFLPLDPYGRPMMILEIRVLPEPLDADLESGPLLVTYVGRDELMFVGCYMCWQL